jgi:preprotein translocase subunit SecF
MIHRIIQTRKFFLSFSVLAITASILALVFWGLNFGIDFTGGSLLEGKFVNYQPSIINVQDSLQSLDLHSLVVQSADDNSVILRFQENDEDTHQKIVSNLQNLATSHSGASFEESHFDSVGPSIGQELKNKSFNVTIITIIMIIIFISWAFRHVSKPISSWKYSVAAIIALVHDVIFTLGVFSVLGHFYGIEINSQFIAAILTVLGYSVNDTIVVFDRIRENLPKSRENFENTVNLSINQIITRSINTSLSSVLVLLAVLFLGGNSIRTFALALVVGISVGTYSSIFIASPILVIWDNLGRRRRALKE